MAKIAVDPVPRPTTMPDWTSDAGLLLERGRVVGHSRRRRQPSINAFVETS